MLFRYKLSEKSLDVKVGSLTVRSILYSDIESVKEDYEFWNEHWTNLMPFRYVTIRRKTGWFRNFIINPINTKAFINDLQNRLEIRGKNGGKG